MGLDQLLQLAKIIFRYMEWVFNKYSLERNDDVKCLLVKSFVETFKMDAQAPKLKEFSVVSTSVIFRDGLPHR